MKKLAAALAAALTLAASIAIAQTVFNEYTALTGAEVIQDASNPTGAYFTSKLLATGGLAAVATTVSALPACAAATKGDLYVVTDANSPTYGGALTGGSTTVALALCTGSSWLAH